MTWAYIRICVLSLICGFCLGSVFAFFMARYNPVAEMFPEVSLATINDKPALVVSFLACSSYLPHSLLYGVNFDDDNKTIDLKTFMVIRNPFSPHVYNRSPIIIQHIPAGMYMLRFWDGEEYIEMGRVIAVGKEGNSIEWHPGEKPKRFQYMRQE